MKIQFPLIFLCALVGCAHAQKKELATAAQSCASGQAPSEIVLFKCPNTHKLDNNYRANCEMEAKTKFNFLLKDWPNQLMPISKTDIKYIKGGVCIDTFVPGREMDDCYDNLEATIAPVCRK